MGDKESTLGRKIFPQVRIDIDKRFESDFDQLAKKISTSKSKKDGK
jgi:hypothetical protein